MRSLTLAIAIGAFVAGSSSAADDGFTAEKARELIPDAAGMPAEELQKLSSDPVIGKFKPSKGDSLTWWVLTYSPGPDSPKNPTSFRFLGETVNPAAFASALTGPKGKDGKPRKYASVIHPEYITDCTVKVDGETATGVVTFKAEKVYEGKVEYSARRKKGEWRIVEFRLPDYKVTLARGDDDKWVKK